jgi:hypothetical protein
MGISSHYDEDGHLVVYDPNITTQRGACTEGHHILIRSQNGETTVTNP